MGEGNGCAVFEEISPIAFSCSSEYVSPNVAAIEAKSVQARIIGLHPYPVLHREPAVGFEPTTC